MNSVFLFYNRFYSCVEYWQKTLLTVEFSFIMRSCSKK